MPGAIRLVRVAGIEVFVHWSWAIIALISIQFRAHSYSSRFFSALEYLSLFAIVLLHEFGHALACRSVGGRAERIVLWPLGGIAYVAPPPRPGAVLWSIAAGPLVNVALVPITIAAAWVTNDVGANSDIVRFFRQLAFINGALLVFNMLPIYPLDGGQILHAVLWFFIGRGRSLMVAAIVGFVGAGAMIVGALYLRSVWFGILAFFNIQRARSGYAVAKALRARELAPRHQGPSCPRCHQAPPKGAHWLCPCGNTFDTFDTNASCPRCTRQFATTACVDCGESSPRVAWHAS
jgi:Zn-dependent protease